MAAQGLAAKPAFKAHNIVGLHRAPYWHSRRRRPRYRRRRALAEAAERAMHRRDQAPDLIDADAIFGDITTDDLSNQLRINLR
jgi:hypothetical protein